MVAPTAWAPRESTTETVAFAVPNPDSFALKRAGEARKIANVCPTARAKRKLIRKKF